MGRSREFPRDIYKKASDVGILGTGYPEAYGGTPGDIFFQIAVWEELMRSGSGGFVASLGSLNIALPPIVRLGTEEQKKRYLPQVLAGEKIAALAITEPGGGSDVANLQTTAVRRRRPLCRQRQQGIYYQRLPGRSDHLRGPNRRRRRAWHQLTCHRIQNSGLFRIRKTEKNRVVVIGYGADLF